MLVQDGDVVLTIILLSDYLSTLLIQASLSLISGRQHHLPRRANCSTGTS